MVRSASKPYRDELGILPEAFSNYLLRLGWGHGDEDIVPIARAIELFDLGGVGRSPSRFDLKKLENLTGIISARPTTPGWPHWSPAHRGVARCHPVPE